LVTAWDLSLLRTLFRSMFSTFFWIFYFFLLFMLLCWFSRSNIFSRKTSYSSIFCTKCIFRLAFRCFNCLTSNNLLLIWVLSLVQLLLSWWLILTSQYAHLFLKHVHFSLPLFNFPCKFLNNFFLVLFVLIILSFLSFKLSL